MSESPSKPPLETVPWECIDRFIGKFTHDIRNGLNAFELQLTYLGEICDDPEAAAETKRLRASLLGVTKHLQAVRVAASEPTLNTMDYPAAEFLEDLRERFEKLEEAAAAKPEWAFEAGNVLVTIDPELTINSLLEVLKNAVHFGGDAPEFSIQVSVGESLNLVVRESKGADALEIDTAEWGREPLRSSRRNAYGLGLFRARRIFEAEGGAISAEFSAVDQSLTTTVKLPLAST